MRGLFLRLGSAPADPSRAFAWDGCCFALGLTTCGHTTPAGEWIVLMPMGEAIQAAVSQLERIRPDAIFADDTHYSQLVWSGSTRICSI